MSKILVTGGAGYIGSHTVVSLLEAGYKVVILDNLSNSHPKVIERINQICSQKPIFIKGDILDANLLAQIFSQHKISAVIHFAGLKSVGESVKNPLIYYQNNLNGSLVLAQEMAKAEVYQLIFSSSATIYGTPSYLPFDSFH